MQLLKINIWRLSLNSQKLQVLVVINCFNFFQYGILFIYSKSGIIKIYL